MVLLKGCYILVASWCWRCVARLAEDTMVYKPSPDVFLSDVVNSVLKGSNNEGVHVACLFLQASVPYASLEWLLCHHHTHPE
jgi:hypothetical protein